MKVAHLDEKNDRQLFEIRCGTKDLTIFQFFLKELYILARKTFVQKRYYIRQIRDIWKTLANKRFHRALLLIMQLASTIQQKLVREFHSGINKAAQKELKQLQMDENVKKRSKTDKKRLDKTLTGYSSVVSNPFVS